MRALQSSLVFGLIVGSFSALAQQSPAPAPPSASGSSSTPAASASSDSPADSAGSFQFRTGTRLVISDVDVTDSHGSPVRNLPRSAFQIWDSGRPQTIASFQEHSSSEALAPGLVPVPTGVYSNEGFGSLPPVLTILVLDVTRTSFSDQAYLVWQLDKFFDQLAPGQPLAIYVKYAESTILLQPLTTDREQLRRTVHNAIPRLPAPGGRASTESQTLNQIALDLIQIPGRKKVLWFGGDPSRMLSNPMAAPPQLQHNLELIYDTLEKGRISVFPIDARGVMVNPPIGDAMAHGYVAEAANATGGRAFSRNNNLASLVSEAISLGNTYYTLSFRPRDFRYDNKFHPIRISVSGGRYSVSYRSGYFADASQESSPDQPRSSAPRTRLLAQGRTARQQPDPQLAPLLFSVRLLRADELPADSQVFEGLAPPASKVKRCVLSYSLPLQHLQHQTDGDADTFELGVAAFVRSDLGTELSHNGRRVSIRVRHAQSSAADTTSTARVPIEQVIDLPRGSRYLHVMLWDLRGQRMGSVDLPLNEALDAGAATTASR